MTTHQQIGSDTVQVMGGVQVPLFQSSTIASDDCFVSPLGRTGRAGKNVVPSKCHSTTIDFTMQTGVVLGLSRHPVATEWNVFPFNHVAILDDSIELKWPQVLAAILVGRQQRTQVVIPRTFELVGDPFHCPELCSVFVPQVGRLHSVITMHVSHKHSIDLLQA